MRLRPRDHFGCRPILFLRKVSRFKESQTDPPEPDCDPMIRRQPPRPSVTTAAVAQSGHEPKITQRTQNCCTGTEPLLNFLRTLERRVVKPGLRRLKPWRYVTNGDIRVTVVGRTFGIDYLPLFQDLGMPREPRVFEWCAGPGFTGFALLATVFARRFVSPTSTRKLSKPAGSPWRATDCQSGSPFVAQRIWMGSPIRMLGSGCWQSAASCPLYPRKRTSEPARVLPSAHQLRQLGDIRRNSIVRD
jgi:hypothetical protein